jgi:hypothetical protein
MSVNMKSLLEEAEKLEEEKFLASIATKKHPPEGIFATGSAEKITKWAIASHPDMRGAISAITFYVTRAGSKLSGERKGVMAHAKELVHKHYGK